MPCSLRRSQYYYVDTTTPLSPGHLRHPAGNCDLKSGRIPGLQSSDGAPGRKEWSKPILGWAVDWSPLFPVRYNYIVDTESCVCARQISEDGDITGPPVVPERSAARRLTATNSLQTNSYMSMSQALPPYSAKKKIPNRTPEPQRDADAGIKYQDWIARRGGWYRVVLITLLLVGLIIGLAVGLTIGPQKGNQASTPALLPTGLFPAGSYAFTTALANVSTGCTSNPSTWSCYPFSTYSPSAPDLSATTFYWEIEPVTTYLYAISSSANPFAPTFTNVSLTLIDGNQYTERFAFNFTMAPKAVELSAQVGNDKNAKVTCWFNSTVMSATIWTRMRASYPANITEVAAPVNATNVFAPWPFAVEIKQVQDASNGVPDCRDAAGRPVGGDLRPNATTQAQGGTVTTCSCSYSNRNLPSTKGNHSVKAARSRPLSYSRADHIALFHGWVAGTGTGKLQTSERKGGYYLVEGGHGISSHFCHSDYLIEDSDGANPC
ncbi:hypothetical protein QBC46DRAFT_448055 [Diplogelasinospora grovesii]|uniref:Uncharacterized protein n=1 Tax=Diplogelasinospora grovesii TaxID=303347 RepID=A0AAN6NCC8_9PEZI|nr:hypothetical protein QBC46DRAFT_448055 [Diplogelasinospora grovesii]